MPVTPRLSTVLARASGGRTVRPATGAAAGAAGEDVARIAGG